MWLNGRSSLWYSVDPQQVWTRTFIRAHTSLTRFSTFSSSDVTCALETWRRRRNHGGIDGAMGMRPWRRHPTSSWKATVLTEPRCLMRSATTSSGFPRLTTRLLSDRCKKKRRHTLTSDCTRKAAKCPFQWKIDLAQQWVQHLAWSRL